MFIRAAGVVAAAATSVAVGGGMAAAETGLVAGYGSEIAAVPWQICGSEVPIVGGLGTGASAAMTDDCINAPAPDPAAWEEAVADGAGAAIFNGSSLNAAPWQICGSEVPIVGGLISVASPTAAGDCVNTLPGQTQSGSDVGLSALNGSAVNALPWQICGSEVPIVGGSLSVLSDAAAGICSNVPFQPQTQDTGTSLFDSSNLSVAPWQICGSQVPIVGGTIPVASTATAALCENIPG